MSASTSSSEVLGLLHDLGETQDLLESAKVTPEQFRGIEVKRWAKEIAELVLWIGYLQWQVRTRTSAKAVPEPVLRDFGNIEYRDAVLAYDREEPVLDDKGVPVTRWNGITTKTSPVTGEEIPDESARVVVYRYVNPRKASWPAADFVVGNPPFIGGWRIRQALGDGYVEALWRVNPHISEKADYVMYWWDKAAELARSGQIRQFGFITTNSISQAFQRRVLAHHIHKGLSIFWAIADHPWIDSASGAAVRIAMTVGNSNSRADGTLVEVVAESPGEDAADVVLTERVGVINTDLTIGADVTRAGPLQANKDICSPGVQLYGSGFIVAPEDAKRLGLGLIPGIGNHIKPYVNGRDITGKSRGVLVIDCFGLEEQDLQNQFPALYQHILLRVKPERDANRRASIREMWWRFGWERPAFRASIAGLRRYISTSETSKHRFFVFLDSAILPDNKLTNFSVSDAFFMGILSSKAHVTWALRSGGLLEDRPVYVKSFCFDPFPFPECSEEQKAKVRGLGEALDAHRKYQQALNPDLTMTGMYNILEKLRAGEPLTEKDKVIHEQGLVTILKQIHDDLDAAVFDAYGWPHDLTDEQILERVVALNAERAEEERNGLIRWLRPEFQNPSGFRQETQAALPGTEIQEEATILAVTAWPRKLPEQVSAVRDLLLAGRTWSVEQVAKTFKGARRRDVEGVLESLTALGIAVTYDTPDGKRWRGIERGTAVT